MATKEKSPVLQRQGSTEEEHTSPKKRRKVNHGRCDIHDLQIALSLADGLSNSMCLLSAIGKQVACLAFELHGLEMCNIWCEKKRHG